MSMYGAMAGYGPPRTTSLAVVVPVYNEQYLVETSLRRLRVLEESPLLQRIKIIVVNDTSTDETPAALQRFQESLQACPWGDKFEWQFLAHERNQGKGGAVRTGLRQADTEITVIHDADLEYHPRDLLKMIPLFLEEDADAVFGSRFLVGHFVRVLFFWHSLGNRILTLLCNLVSDLNLTDMETCYKMVRTALLKSIPLQSTDFRIEPEMTIKLAKRGARIFEVPISYSGRTYQEGKKINARDGVLALCAILKYACSERLYLEDAHGGQMLWRFSRAPRYTRWIADVVRPYIGACVLEVGAGNGQITVNLCPRSLYWATDVNPLFLAELQKLSQARPYLHVAYMDITQPRSLPTEPRFDTVVCLHALEHVGDDVAVLRHLRRLLMPHGRVVALVPRGPQLYGPLDQELGRHRRYTYQQIIEVGRRAGFRAETVVHFNRLGGVWWWLNSRILRRARCHQWQIILLNWLVPVLRRLDGWLPLPALSLLVIFTPVAQDE